MLTLAKKKVDKFLEELSQNYKVVVPIPIDGAIHWKYYTKKSKVDLDYSTTSTSLKHLLFPSGEKLLEFNGDELSIPDGDEKIIIFGLRPYDINSIEILDEIFTQHHIDEHYVRKRDYLITIVVDGEPSEDNFYNKFNLKLKTGFDVFLKDAGDSYNAVVGTEVGSKILDSKIIKDKEFKPTKKNPADQQKLDLDKVKKFLDKGPDQELWHRLAKKCFACGACAYVCPICHCFDMEDRINLDGKTGYRCRHWDSCMLADFAQVAGGGNFRKERYKRIHNWYHHKFSRAIDERGKPDCVGCGRCITYCPAKIQIHDILKECEANG